LRAGWADDGEVSGPPPELPVQHEEGETAEVVAVQVAHDHGIDGVRVDLLLAQRGQAGGPTVQQHRGRRSGVGRQGDAGLEPPARAERIAATRHRHSHQPIIVPRQRPVEVQACYPQAWSWISAKGDR